MAMRIHYTDFVLALFTSLTFLHAMAAYNLAFIPLPWLAQAGFITLFAWVSLRYSVFRMPGITLLVTIVIWAITNTFINSSLTEYSNLMGSLTTTPYPVFIGLRIINILFFVSVLGLSYWLLRKGLGEELLEKVVIVGAVVSVLAFYIYVAQVYGLWEPPRNRLGTSGGIARTSFTYAFHRATGTFREPSHLAEWLVIPFCLSFVLPKKKLFVCGLIIGACILLTGSLTGIIAIIVGFALAALLSNPLVKHNWTNTIKVTGLLGLALLLFSMLVSQSQENAGLIHVVWNRISPIIFGGGVSVTNRNYVYEFVDQTAIPFFGYGLGNANLIFSQWLGIESIPSFLNLFINVTYSLGFVGLVMFLIFFFYPLGLYFIKRPKINRRYFIYLMAGYLSWLWIFNVHADELNLMYALAYAFFIHEILFPHSSGGSNIEATG